MSAEDTLARIDDLLATLIDHWQAPCCGRWHVLAKQDPWPVTCCEIRYPLLPEGTA